MLAGVAQNMLGFDSFSELRQDEVSMCLYPSAITRSQYQQASQVLFSSKRLGSAQKGLPAKHVSASVARVGLAKMARQSGISDFIFK